MPCSANQFYRSLHRHTVLLTRHPSEEATHESVEFKVSRSQSKTSQSIKRECQVNEPGDGLPTVMNGMTIVERQNANQRLTLCQDKQMWRLFVCAEAAQVKCYEQWQTRELLLNSLTPSTFTHFHSHSSIRLIYPPYALAHQNNSVPTQKRTTGHGKS